MSRGASGRVAFGWCCELGERYDEACAGFSIQEACSQGNDYGCVWAGGGLFRALLDVARNRRGVTSPLFVGGPLIVAGLFLVIGAVHMKLNAFMEQYGVLGEKTMT